MSVAIRETQNDDRSAVLALQRAFFGEDSSLALDGLWDWLGRCAEHCGCGARGFVAEHVSNGIVGAIGLVPRRCVVMGEAMLAAQTYSFVARPEYRGVGLDLIRRVFADERFGLAYTLSCNEVSARIWSGLKAVEIPGFQTRWLLPLRPRWFAQSVARRAGRWAGRAAAALLSAVPAFASPGYGDLEATTATDPQVFDDVWRRVDAGDIVGLVRDASYASWRYFQRPGRPYRVVRVRLAGDDLGCLVLQVRPAGGGTRLAWLLEAFTCDSGPASAARMLRAAAMAAAEADADALTGHLTATLAEAAEGLGFRPIHGEMNPARLRCNRLRNGLPAAAVRMADGDGDQSWWR